MSNDLLQDLKKLTREVNKEMADFRIMMNGDEGYLEGLREYQERLLDIILRYEE